MDDRIVLHNEPCGCGNTKPWLELEGRTDDILTFENDIRIAPLSLYAIIKEVHGIQRFQLVQKDEKILELRLIADDVQKVFTEAKQVIEAYLCQNGVTAEVYLSDKTPETNPISGKYKHIVAK